MPWTTPRMMFDLARGAKLRVGEPPGPQAGRPRAPISGTTCGAPLTTCRRIIARLPAVVPDVLSPLGDLAHRLDADLDVQVGVLVEHRPRGVARLDAAAL